MQTEINNIQKPFPFKTSCRKPNKLQLYMVRRPGTRCAAYSEIFPPPKISVNALKKESTVFNFFQIILAYSSEKNIFLGKLRKLLLAFCGKFGRIWQKKKLSVCKFAICAIGRFDAKTLMLTEWFFCLIRNMSEKKQISHHIPVQVY